VKRIILVGEYDPAFEPYTFTVPAIQHSGETLASPVKGTRLM